MKTFIKITTRSRYISAFDAHLYPHPLPRNSHKLLFFSRHRVTTRDVQIICTYRCRWCFESRFRPNSGLWRSSVDFVKSTIDWFNSSGWLPLGRVSQFNPIFRANLINEKQDYAPYNSVEKDKGQGSAGAPFNQTGLKKEGKQPNYQEITPAYWTRCHQSGNLPSLRRAICSSHLTRCRCFKEKSK